MNKAIPDLAEAIYRAPARDGLDSELMMDDSLHLAQVITESDWFRTALEQAWNEGFAAVDQNAWVDWATDVPRNPYSTQ